MKSGKHLAVDSGIQVLDSGFSVSGTWIPSLVVFRIPKPRIPDSTSKHFLDSGILKSGRNYTLNLHAFKW